LRIVNTLARASILLLCLLGSIAALPTDSAPLWQQAQGTWRGTGAYLDGTMRPVIPRYASLLRFELQGDVLTQTEWKFYPDSELARAAAGTLHRRGDGVLVIAEARARTAASGGLDFGAAGVFAPVDSRTLARVQQESSTGVTRYLSLLWMTDREHLFVSTSGFWALPIETDYFEKPTLGAQGETRPNSRLATLKGHSLFQYQRLPTNDWQNAVDEHMRQYRVRIRVDTRAGQRAAERVNAP
jgi:hypothetical protein